MIFDSSNLDFKINWSSRLMSVIGVLKRRRSYVIFPTFRRLRCADLMYVYHYTFAFEPDFATLICVMYENTDSQP